jgi:hypothetical protein
VSGRPHGEEETAKLAKTESFDKLRMSARGEPVEPGVLRGSFRLRNGLLHTLVVSLSKQAFSAVPSVSGTVYYTRSS